MRALVSPSTMLVRLMAMVSMIVSVGRCSHSGARGVRTAAGCSCCLVYNLIVVGSVATARRRTHVGRPGRAATRFHLLRLRGALIRGAALPCVLCMIMMGVMLVMSMSILHVGAHSHFKERSNAKSSSIGHSGRLSPWQWLARFASVVRMEFSSSIFWSSSAMCLRARRLTSPLTRR